MLQIASTAEEIFLAAIEIEGAEARSAYLSSICGNAELRHQIERLLALDARASGFLEPAAAARLPTLHGPALLELPGTVIGPYELLNVIGEGGMGIVYLAEQTQPVRRRVALKVIKPGMDTAQVIARFEAERQALALMDHPNIARVLDVGTTSEHGSRSGVSKAPSSGGSQPPARPPCSGRPYFVMELVDGLPITEYCNQSLCSIHERLELFLHVCQAVQHAHQKGIIHRDIKPSNVLVALIEGKAVVKVIDFGIAKAIGHQLTERSLCTNLAQLIGTPLYMSPEQAQLNGVDVDTRSDVYSLGVLLYELLTGSTPFDREHLRTAGIDEVRRIIREDDPPRLITRMNTRGQASATLSEQRRSTPRDLSRLFRSELDWIVMKALEKERNRRYETASALARDLERYLHDEPVQAYPPSAVYRFRKLAKRHTLPIAIAGLCLTVLVLAVFGLTAGLVAVDRARNEAARERDHAEAQRRLARRAVDKMYTEVAEKWLSQQPHLEPLQREFLEEALHYYQASGAERSPDPELRLETGIAYRRVGEIQFKLGEFVKAEEAVSSSIALLTRLTADRPDEPRYLDALASSHHKLGGLFLQRDELQNAEREFGDALQRYEKLAAESPVSPSYVEGRAACVSALASVWLGQGRGGEAVEGYRRALSILELLPPDIASRAESRRSRAHCTLNLGWALATAGQPGQAEASCRQAVDLLRRDAEDFPRDPGARHALACAYWSLRAQLPDRFSPEAESLLRQGLAIEVALVDEFPSVVDYLHGAAKCQASLGEWLQQHGRLVEANKAYGQAIERFEKLMETGSSLPIYGLELTETWISLRPVLLECGRLEEAERTLEKTLAMARKLASGFPSVHRFRHLVALSHQALGIVLGEVRQPQEAEQNFRSALAICSDLVKEHPTQEEYRLSLAWCHNDLADLFAASPAESFRDATQAVQLARKAVALHPAYAGFWNTLGTAHYRAGAYVTAVEELERSMTLNNGGDCYDWFFLAMAHWRLDHKATARAYMARAVDWLERNELKLKTNNLQAARFRRFRAEAASVLGCRASP
jgi:serine/threonine protein kinase/Tfp pilus assembly protein PilF